MDRMIYGYSKTKRQRADRFYIKCDMNGLEDEFHYLTNCKSYEEKQKSNCLIK